MNITEISIKRPSLIIVLFGLFILFGYIGFKNLSYELMPDFNQPVVVITTAYPGAEPAEVETSVSRKIEDALSNLEGVDYLVTKRNWFYKGLIQVWVGLEKIYLFLGSQMKQR